MRRDHSRPIVAAARLVVAWSVIGVAVLLGPAGSGRFSFAPEGDTHNGYLADLQDQVPRGPGVDGQLGTAQDPKVEVPVIGVTDGKAVLDLGLAGAVEGIPAGVLPAYQRAAADIAKTHPGCGLTWPLLAGIGKVESSHASGGRVDARGATRGRILGPVLDGGPGEAAISDTDGGRLDGDARWDRAVGPMQFIPGTWATFGTDGNADGVADPHNVYDAARSAGEYLCSGGADLTDSRGLVAAVLRYNHSMDYVSTVLRWMQLYSSKGVLVPDQTGKVVVPDDDGNAERVVDPTVIPEPDNDEDTTSTDNDTDTKSDDELIIGKDRVDPTANPTTNPTVPPTNPTVPPTAPPATQTVPPSQPTTSVPPASKPTQPRPPTPSKSTPPTTPPSTPPTDAPDPDPDPDGEPTDGGPSTPATSPTTSPDDDPPPPCPTATPTETPATPPATPAPTCTPAPSGDGTGDGTTPSGDTSGETPTDPSGSPAAPTGTEAATRPEDSAP